MDLTAYQKDAMNGKICPYCKSGTRITTEEEVYGKTYKGRSIIACNNFPACDSFVGTHDDGVVLGRLANKELRTAKRNAHHYFDKIWKERYVDRTTLYEELSDYLGIPDEYTHIGMFGVDTCKKVQVWAKQYYDKVSNS